MGEAPIGKLLVEYSIPAIIGMTLTSLYNIIDSIFIGHGVGALAISGLAITFPLMNLLVAFCTLVGVGGATLSSIRLLMPSSTADWHLSFWNRFSSSSEPAKLPCRMPAILCR